MTRGSGWIGLVVCALVGCATPALALELPEAPRVDASITTGEMRGVVTDSSDGIGIRKVRMVLRRGGTREVISLHTDKAGGFRFEALPQGVYSLEATAVGYLPAILAPIVVRPGKDTRIEHISLTPEREARRST